MVNRWAMAIIAILCVSFLWGMMNVFFIRYLPVWGGLATLPPGSCTPTLEDPFRCGDELVKPVDYSGETFVEWSVLTTIWGFSMILCAMIIVFGTLSVHDYKMNNLVRSILDSVTLLVSYSFLMFFWAVFYMPLNVTLANNLDLLGYTKAPGFVSTVMDLGILILMIGLGAIMFFRSFNAPKPKPENQQ